MVNLNAHLCVLFSLACVVLCAEFIPVTPMPVGRSDMSVVVISDGMIVAGGCTSQICPGGVCFCSNVTDLVTLYLPLTNEWVDLPSMPSPRYRHSAAAVGKKMYVVGGRDVNDTIQQSVFVFDVTANSWSTLPVLWTSASSDLVAAVVGNSLYAMSGYSANYETLNTTCVLDTTKLSATWQCGKLAEMNHGRGDACGATINGSIWVFGGFSDSDWCNPLDHVEVFNPLTNSWKEMSPLHYPRGDGACAALHGEFHAIGGEHKDVTCSYDVPIADVEHYDPDTASWIEEQPLADARFRFVGAPFGSVIYIFGGQGYFDNVTMDQPVLNSVMKWVDDTVEISGTPSSFGIGIVFVVLSVVLLL